MRIRILVSMVVMSVAMVFSSCSHTKELAYVSDAERNSAQAIINAYTSSIHSGDRLYIYVSSQTPESVIPFNEETNKGNEGFSDGRTVGYFVSEDGYITFPVLGKIKAEGISRDSLAHEIEHRLLSEGQVTDPIVEVKMMNFRVAVIGEVQSPQELHLESERLTIFEALAMCGDITMDGKRTNVGVVRETDGVVTVGEIDLTSKEVFSSPYYYLRQNDIVYIEPTRKKKRTATRNPNIPSYIALSVSVLSLYIAIRSRFW